MPSNSSEDRRKQGLPDLATPRTGNDGEQQYSSTATQPTAEERTLSLLHDVAGNEVIASALGGSELDGFGAAVAGELSGALGGLDGGGPLSSNVAMARLMRDAFASDLESASRDMRSSSGKQLPSEQQARFGAAFGHDFSHVRVHTDAAAGRAAEALNAHAFALGAEIFFGPGKYQPGSAFGDRLLAHELTHVVQSDMGRLGSGGGESEVSSPNDPHEREAYANENIVVRELGTVDAAVDTPEVDAASEVEAPGAEAREEVAPVESANASTSTESSTSEGSAVMLRERVEVSGGGAVAEDEEEERETSAFESGLLADLFRAGPRIAKDLSASERHALSLLTDTEQEQLLRMAGIEPDALEVDVEAAVGAVRQAGVSDPDDARRQATLRLLTRLAPRLGLNASGIVVHIDDAAAARTQAAGTIGLVADGVVYLDPHAYDPSTRSGQHLLAHEVAHVAQSRLAHDGIAEPMHAEAEAGLFADAFLAGRSGEAGQVPMPSGYVAHYDGPGGGDLSALTDLYAQAAQAKADAQEAKAAAKEGSAPNAGPDKPSERERDEVGDFSDGMDAIVDQIEDLAAFDDLIEAHEESASTSGPMNRIKRSEAYSQVIDMWKGAKKNERHSGAMQSIYNNEFDRGGGLFGSSSTRPALAQVASEGRSDAEAQLAAEAALAELEAARAHEEDAKSEVKDLGGPQPGDESGEGTGTGEGDGGGDLSIVPVPMFPPDAPNFASAEIRQKTVWPAAEAEFSHHESYQAQMSAGASGGWDRFGQVAGEFGKGFVAGFASGFTNGLRDKFLTDLVGGGLDRMIQASPRFGGAMRNVPFAKNLVGAWQSGLLTGDFEQVWSGWTGKYDQAGEAVSGMGAVIDAWDNYSGWDRVGLVIKFAADLFQMLASIFGLITDILGTIETICWVLGGLFIILGIAFSWCGFGFLLPWGLNVIRVARALKRINDVLKPIADALSFIANVLRVISALTVPAEFYGAELAATGAAGEFFGDKAGGQVADTVADEAKKWAESPVTEKNPQAENPVKSAAEDGSADGEALAEASQVKADDNIEQMKQVESEVNQILQENQAKANTEGGETQTPTQTDDANTTNKASSDGGGDDRTRTQKTLSFLRKASGVDGIIKANPVAQFREARDKYQVAKVQVQALWNSNAWEDAAQGQQQKLINEAAGVMAEVGMATSDDPATQDLMLKLVASERQLANMKAGDAPPEQMAVIQNEIKQLRDNPDLSQAVKHYDQVNTTVQKMEDRYQNLKNAQRDDVQLSLLNHLRGEAANDPTHFTKATPLHGGVNDADVKLYLDGKETSQANTQASVDAGVKGHDEATSQKGGPGDPKSSKRGAGPFKFYLDNLVQAGDDNGPINKIFTNLHSNGWMMLLGWSPGKEETPEQTRAQKVAAAEEALTKPKEEGVTFKDVTGVLADPGGKAAGLVNDMFDGLGVPRAYKSLIETPAPEVNPADLQNTFDEASEQMELNAIHHTQAYNAYLMELTAASKAIEADELANTVGTMAVERAKAQEGPLQEAQAKEAQRGQQLAQVDPDVKPADSAMGSLLATIMSAIMEGGSEVDGAPDNVQDSDPSSAQDETAQASKETQQANEDASKEQGEYLKDLSNQRQQVQGGIQADKDAVLNKADHDRSIMEEIRGIKEDNLQKAATHFAAGEAKGSEFNSGLDTLAVWAADYKGKREAAGLSLSS